MLGALTLEGVTKTYGPVLAVDDVSLDVRPGEFITLLGPSGSGKTTTLRIVAGFIEPDAGRVVIDGKDITRLPSHKRNLGMVFQNYALFPHMTAGQNVAFPLAMRRQPKALIKEKVEEALRLVHLDKHSDRYPRQLSGGQQQRVAVARALSFNPHILLMDEPLGALDKKLREVLQLEMMRISRQLAVTVLYVTHDQEEALVMSNRIAIYNNGRIEQLGTSEELYERPNSLFVADFVGQSNIFRGVLHENGGAHHVVTRSGGPIRIPDGAGRRVGLTSGDRAAVVVRPERVWMRPEPDWSSCDAGTTDAAAEIPGRIREVIYLGSDLKFLVEIAGGDTVTVRVPAGEGSTEVPTDPGVRIGWSASDSVVVGDPQLQHEPDGAAEQAEDQTAP